MAEVSTPSDYKLDYEDVVLDTPDHVKVRAYLLVQRKNLPQATSMGVADDMTDEEVGCTMFLVQPVYIFCLSSQPQDRLL